ncbi:hypothetical protein ACQ4PT_024659 [Festuca glaucescens]
MARASRRQHGAVVLGLHASSDRPKGVSRGQYWLGFFLSLGATALYGLVLRSWSSPTSGPWAAGCGRMVTYALVVEMQLVMSFFATAFCTADTAPPSDRLQIHNNLDATTRPDAMENPVLSESPRLQFSNAIIVVQNHEGAAVLEDAPIAVANVEERLVLPVVQTDPVVRMEILDGAQSSVAPADTDGIVSRKQHRNTTKIDVHVNVAPIRRNERSKCFQGFKNNLVSDKPKRKSQVKHHHVPGAVASTVTEVASSSAAGQTDDEVVLEPTPIPFLQHIGVQLCGVPPEELSPALVMAPRRNEAPEEIHQADNAGVSED